MLDPREALIFAAGAVGGATLLHCYNQRRMGLGPTTCTGGGGGGTTTVPSLQRSSGGGGAAVGGGAAGGGGGGGGDVWWRRGRGQGVSGHKNRVSKRDPDGGWTVPGRPSKRAMGRKGRPREPWGAWGFGAQPAHGRLCIRCQT